MSSSSKKKTDSEIISGLKNELKKEILAAILDGQAASKPKATRAAENPLSVGATVLIRTVTHYYTGRVVAITDGEIVLEDAAWVADTKRWSETLKTGALNEVEPYPDGQVVVFRGACVDLAHWDHALPRKAHP